MYVKCYSAHIYGLEGRLIEVEVDISPGLPNFDLVGLPGSALKEAKERVRSAIKNSGYVFPNRRITVNLAPAHLRKEGSFFDLPIALGILLADKQIRLTPKLQQALHGMIMIGELSLDGHIRKSVGVLPLVLAAKEQEFKKMLIPYENEQEAKVISEVQAIGVQQLCEVVQFLEEGLFPNPNLTIRSRPRMAGDEEIITESWQQECVDFAQIKGQEQVKRAFEIAVCGHHHLLLSGPPGSGKTLLAKSFVSLLPDLSMDEAIEVTKIYSVAGLLQEQEGLRQKRALRQPHHSITVSAMIGGGTPIRPGEITLAHEGVLFLDEFLEFKREVLEALREPLQEGKITISRGQQTFTYPARFLLITALNPCPCGYYGFESAQKSCTCSATQIRNYQNKLSGPIFDRIDMHLSVPPIPYEDLFQNNPPPSNAINSTENMQKRIQQGLTFKQERYDFYQRKGVQPLPVAEDCKLTSEAEALLRLAFEHLSISARAYHKILRLGRTIADLNQAEMIDEAAIAEALQYRALDS